MSKKKYLDRGDFQVLDRLLTIFAVVLLFCSPVLSQTEEIEDDMCLACHEDYDIGLSSTKHQLSTTVTNAEFKIGCTSCHNGGEIHVEDPSVDNISNPANLTGYDAVSLCSNCHVVHQSMDNYGFDNHSNQELNCSECHSVHGGKQKLLFDENAVFCQKCHFETKTKFQRRSNHPLEQGVLNCLSCHRFTKRQDSNLMFDLERTCQGCHPENGGPFLYEHQTVNAHAVDGSGCVECHDPHGSENDYLLKQPVNNLCSQCHIEHITRNHDNLWESVWSKYSCQTCHMDTHGSFVSNQYLDPDLPEKLGGDCYNSGCHSLNKH